jgi:protein SCO1
MKALMLASLLSFCSLAYAEPALPGDSVYQVGGVWKTESDLAIPLESLAGKPQVVALVFTGCSNACPVIVESMKRVERQIPSNMRNQVGFILVSLTPETDSVKSLKTFYEKKQLNKNWKVLRGNDELVRALSNALNSRYKILKKDDVAHSNTVTLLNSRGQIQVQASGTVEGIQPIMQAIDGMRPNTPNQIRQ